MNGACRPASSRLEPVAPRTSKQGQLGRLEEAESALSRYVQAEIDEDERRNATVRLRFLRERIAQQGDGSTPEGAEPASQGLGAMRKAAIASWVIGALGAVDFAIFAALSSSEANARESCRGTCSDDEVSDLRTYNVLADVGLAVGIAGAVTGAVLWIAGGPVPLQVSTERR